LNRFPELKSFLKDGEAESYEDVKVTYVPGKTAILTIYKKDDNTKLEEIVLHELKTKDHMHKLFQEKGFVRKENYQELITEMKKLKETERRERIERARNSVATKKNAALSQHQKQQDVNAGLSDIHGVENDRTTERSTFESRDVAQGKVVLLSRLFRERDVSFRSIQIFSQHPDVKHRCP